MTDPHLHKWRIAHVIEHRFDPQLPISAPVQSLTLVYYCTVCLETTVGGHDF